MDDAVQTALDRLLVTPPRAFVETRTQIVAELKAAGNVAGAKVVAAARRPSPSAWALNVVARDHRKELAAYVDATSRLRAAQRDAVHKEALAPFSAARRDVAEGVGTILALAKGVMAAEGLGWTPEVKRRIAQSLHAVALADDDVRARLLAGRLEADIEPPSDFEALAASLGAGARPRKEERPPAKAAATTGEEAARANPVGSRARGAQARAEERRKAARVEEERRAKEKRDKALARVRELEAKASELEQRAVGRAREADKVEREARQARDAADRAEKVARAARNEADAARKAARDDAT